MLKVIPIPAFTDNYIWCIQSDATSHVVVVDPGDADPVLKLLDAKQWSLSAILVTHHHADHVGGLSELLSRYDVPVFGPKHSAIKAITHPLQEGDTLTLPALDYRFDVLEVPGHTLDHIAYYGEQSLFCGDTLFSAGCGRLFEGTPEQLFTALQRFAGLPDNTAVYCTHEYTAANLDFALAVEPNNPVLLKHLDWVKQQYAEQKASLPSTIATEKTINPFLRCDAESIQTAAAQHAGHPLDDSLAVFTALREWKDYF